MMEVVERIGWVGEAVVADDGRNKGISTVTGPAIRGPGRHAEQHDHDGDDHGDPKQRHEDHQQKSQAHAHDRTVSDAFGRGQ